MAGFALFVGFGLGARLQVQVQDKTGKTRSCLATPPGLARPARPYVLRVLQYALTLYGVVRITVTVPYTVHYVSDILYESHVVIIASLVTVLDLPTARQDLKSCKKSQDRSCLVGRKTRPVLSLDNPGKTRQDQTLTF